MLMIIFYFLLIGATAGLLSGLIGIGGGIVIIPTLAYLFHSTQGALVPLPMIMQASVATSLMAILFTSLASAHYHYRKSSIRWDIWKSWIAGLCLGAFLGPYFATLLSSQVLRFYFAIFLLFVVVKLVFEKSFNAFIYFARSVFKVKTLSNSINRKKSNRTVDVDDKPKKINARTITLFFLGILISLLSGMLGIGGGLLMTPILIRLGCTMPESAGTSSASMIPLSIIAVIAFITMGNMQHISIPWTTGYIYWPAVIPIGIMGVLCAPLGAKLSYRLPAVWIKRLLACILFFVSLDMLI